MSHTPKSERQLNKADAEESRWGKRSHATAEPNAADKKHAAAFDRYDAKHAHNTRDYNRFVRRDIAQRRHGSER